MFENGQNQIHISPNPIRDCPEDVLRMVFDYATRTDGHKLRSFKAATTISHVCNHWRVVSLRMSSMWAPVSISMNDNVEDVILFVERTRARLGTTPADIEIKDIGENTIDVMEKMIESIELQKFKAVSNLNYYIEELYDLVHLTTLIQISTCASVNNVGITQDSVSEEEREWDGTCILLQFPSLTSLLLDITAKVTFINTESYNTLRTLEIWGQWAVLSFSLQILRFPELTNLEIIEFEWDSQAPLDHIIMPRLRYLSLWNVRNVPWSKISAPCLEHMITTNGIADETIEFFCRHPSISALECYIESREESFKRLARYMVNLESLKLDYSPKGLYEEHESTVHFPPFPKLKELIIDDRRKRLSLSEFEAFVRYRFLSQGTPTLATLTKWQIFVHSSELEALPWYSSTLMKHLQVKEEKVDEQTDLRCVTIRLK